MRKLILITIFSIPVLSYCQVAIGKSSITNSSVSLEFGNYIAGEGRGLILPWVTSQFDMPNAEQGTIVFDTNDKILKYRKNDGTWFHLTNNGTATIGGVSNYNITGAVDTTLQDTNTGVALIEESSAKTSIGTPTNTPGILVLEENNKAMILPKVPSPHLNIINPEPGTIVYDTVSKQLAVYNGTVWSFWKP